MYITANYELTRGECRRALRAIGRWPRIVFWGIIVPLVMCGELYVVMIWKGGGISLVPYGIVFVSIMTWTHIRDVSRQARRICVPTTVRLTNDVVEIQTSQGVHVRGWTSFVKTVATSEFWLLYTKKRYAIIIPRRAFLVAEQAEIDSFLGALSVTGAA